MEWSVLEDLLGLQSGLPTLPLEQRRGAEGCKPSLSTDEDMKQSFQFRTHPGTNFAGKPRYPTSFRLGHLPTIHHYLEASSNDEEQWTEGRAHSGDGAQGD